MVYENELSFYTIVNNGGLWEIAILSNGGVITMFLETAIHVKKW